MTTQTLLVRDVGEGEMPEVERVWEESQKADDPLGLGRGWLVGTWANRTRVLVEGQEVVGVAALRAPRGSQIAAGRVALSPSRREFLYVSRLLEALYELAGEASARSLRVTAAASSQWLTGQLEKRRFERVRRIFRMLRPADAPRIPTPSVEGVRMRALKSGEEESLLAALNRAWEGTWNFQPISPEMIERDLAGQREGMLVAVPTEDDSRLVGTCHAIYDSADRNPNGDPRAWISNLTADPEWRGKGLGRALLVGGLNYLYSKGARSVGLGVDGDNLTPVSLYLSVGFEVISEMAIWEGELNS